MALLVKKYFYFIFPLCCLAIWLFLWPSKESKKNEHQLIIGLQAGYPPFEFLDSSGKIVGFDLDIAHLLAKKMNKELVVKDMEFEGIILSLKQGKIDLALSGMNITPSRLKEIEMVPYHGNHLNSYSLIFWNDIPSYIQSIEDFKKHPEAIIVVETGALPEIYMQQKHPKILAKSLQGALNPLMDVKYGKSLANLVEPDVAEYLQGKFPEIKTLSVPLSPEDNILGYGIGIKKGNHKLLEEVSHCIDELKASGELGILENKWFKGK